MAPEAEATNFIRNIIDNDLKNNKNNGKVITRFPPEPNGYLHIGHAKSICLNFSLAQSYNLGPCHLRFDDTNPISEELEYLEAIKDDVRWLGFDWGENLFHSSDYFDKLYECAVELIKAGKAYVCDLSAEAFQKIRGDFNTPGKDSPNRSRTVEENLALFARMREGDFADGTHTLRAKIDMQSGNMNLRDPALYRIRRATHPRTGNKWCIYPMYDYAHPLSDAFEKITHSICTLEFQDHRPLYEWLIENCNVDAAPQQIEFSRLNLNYTMTSKRKLRYLVENNLVAGWDDPRMPTLRGLRRRGVTPESIRNFCASTGVSKQDSTLDMNLFEAAIRNDLNEKAPRRMAVLEPIKVIIENYPEGQSETFDVPNHPQHPELGRRTITFSREIYIDADDFMEVPEKKFFRLGPNKEARLLYAYVVHCHDFKKDDKGNITELRCTYLPETKGGQKPADGHKVKGVIHWVNVADAVDAEVRLYDRLFNAENPKAFESIEDALNPHSLTAITQAKIEPSLAEANNEERFQFNRLGYFCADRVDHAKATPVFNRIVSLRETWK